NFVFVAEISEPLVAAATSKRLRHVGGPDEAFFLLVDDVAGLAGVGVDFDEPEALVAEVIFLDQEVISVGEPADIGSRIAAPLTVVNAFKLRLGLLLVGKAKCAQFVRVELVAGEGVDGGLGNGAAYTTQRGLAVGERRRGFDAIDFLIFTR